MFFLIFIYIINKINTILEYNFIQKNIPINTLKKYNIENLYQNITKKNNKNNNNNNLLRNLEYIEINTLSSYENVLTINILIGSNKENFNVIFDTGSPLLWIAGKNSNDDYHIPHHFDYKNSLTFSTDYSSFSIAYGSGSCNGIYGNDNVYVNDNNFVNIIFGVAQNTQVNFYDLADGIVGIGKFYDNEKYNFIGQLKEQKKIEKYVFSLKTFLNNTGKLFLGDEHSDFKNNKEKIKEIKMKSSSYLIKNFWSGTLQYITIGERNKKNYRKNSIPIFSEIAFDTGTSLNLINDKNLLNDILNLIKSENNNENKCIIKEIEKKGAQRIIFCENIENIPNISFTFDGNSFIIPNNLIFNDSKYIIEDMDIKIDKKYKFFCNILSANIGFFNI